MDCPSIGRNGPFPYVLHHGAVSGVTGSAHEWVIGEQASVLIDCGLFQGRDQGPGGASADNLAIDFDISRIQALVLTHVHIDHVGLLPSCCR
jgi:metallo-beta-lactamase family protein